MKSDLCSKMNASPYAVENTVLHSLMAIPATCGYLRQTLDEKSRKCLLLRYGTESKAYRLYD